MKKFSILITFLLATFSLSAQTIQDGVATFPDGTTEIPKKALKGNKEVTVVIIPNTVTKIGDEAFRDCSNLKDVVIPALVTSIGKLAFKNTGIMEITIPPSVTSIGDGAFNDCTKLTNLVIPASVKSIGAETFKNTGIKEIIIPPSVMSIGDKAFVNCENLTSVKVRRNSKPHRLLKDNPEKIEKLYQDPPELVVVDRLDPPQFSEREPMTTALGDKIENGVLYIKEGTTNIPKKAYSENPFFHKIVIPSTVTKIEDQAFFACPNLIEIDIPSSVKTVGKGAFQDCFWVTKITLHEGLTNLDNKVFKHTGITELTIPSTVTSIGEEVFGCTPLTDVTIPPNVMTISNKVLAESDLTAIRATKDSKAHIFFKDNPNLVVSGELNQAPQFTMKGTSTTELGDTIENGVLYIKEGTTQIKNKSYSGNLDFQKVVIPSTVTKIGNQAFIDCKNLIEIDIPSSVKSIEIEAFQNCIWLSKLTLHEGLTKLSSRSFKNTGIKSLRIPASVKEFYDNVFAGCSALIEIEIPSSVTRFGNGTFKDCKSLTSIRVDKYSEAHAFFSVDERIAFTDVKPTKTKEEWKETSQYSIMEDGVLYISKSIKKIQGDQYKNRGIREIVFTDTVEKIDTGVFQKNNELKKVVIPGNVKVIVGDAFSACSNLEEVIFEEGVEKVIGDSVYGFSFYNCTNLKSVYFPKSIQKITGDGALNSNKSSRIFHCYLGSYAYNMFVKKGCTIDIVGIDEEHAGEITNLVCTGNKTIPAGMFKKYPAEIAVLSDLTTEIGKNAFHEQTKLRIKWNCYANHWAISNGYYIYDIINEEFYYTKDKSNSEAKQFDISPKITELGPFVDNITLRAKQNTNADKCLKESGYYLCGVLADLNTYTKDKSKEIKEDFTRILCDDDPYWRWRSYKFNTKQALKLEEVDDKLVITSFMLYPCKNVTVTDKNGKTLIKNKTIQPLTRTDLCDFDFLTDSVDNYTITSDDELYNKLISIPTKWNISFDSFFQRTTHSNKLQIKTMNPFWVREYIGGVFNTAYIVGIPEYDRRCYEAVDNHTLATNSKLTEFLTREQMEKLLKTARDYSFQFGRCDNGGLGGGNTIYLDGTFLGAISRGSPNAFWHEFSHCMGWGHHNGNMCCEGLPPPFNVDWPSIGSKLYQDEYKKGTTPYLFDKHYLNSNFFSIEYRRPKPIQHDVIRKGTLYIGDKMPCTGSHKDWHDFTKVEMPSTVELISDSAFCGTPIREFTIPPQVRIIGKEAFKDCRFIENIDIPDNIKQAGNAAFQDCTLLSKVKIGKGLRQLNFRLFKGSGLKEITIPKNIQLIESEAFADCKKLKKVVIEEGVRKINDKAFDNTALTEITIPASVTMFGKNITSKDVVWNVKPGTAAYEYAKENNYKIKLSPEDLNKIASQILAECKNAVEAPADKWETETFPAYDNRYKWNFTSSLKGSGEYNVTFTYKNGASMICLSDALIAADGKAIAYFPETRTAGSKSKQIVYTFNVPNGTKKLELFAFAKRAENKTSNGTVTAESAAEYTAKILAESANVEPVSPDGWENGVFTKNDVLRKWDFSDKINGAKGGDYVFRFSYIDGSDILRLTDSKFIADGKVIGHYPEMLSVGEKFREVVYNITVPKGTKKLEMFALARAGQSINRGTITVSMDDDDSYEGLIAKIIADTKKAASAPADKWNKDTFTTNSIRRKWDFSSSVKGSGEYVVTFSLTEGDKDKLVLTDALFIADGNPLEYLPWKQTVGKDSPVLYKINLPNATKKLELSAIVKKTGGEPSGTVKLESLDAITSRILSEGKSIKSIKPASVYKWDNDTISWTDDRYKWDFSSSLDGGGEYMITVNFTGGGWDGSLDHFKLHDVLFIADGKGIAYYPRKYNLSASSCIAYFIIDVPDGTKKLEMYGRAGHKENGYHSEGKITVEKEE